MGDLGYRWGRAPVAKPGPGGSLPTLLVGSSAISYRLRRSARARRLRLTVQPDGVEVVAPVRLREPEIVRFVEQHRHWLLAKVSRLRRALAAHPGQGRLADGGQVPYRGRPVELRIGPASGARALVRYRDGFEVRLPAAHPGGRARAVDRGRPPPLAAAPGAPRCPAPDRASRAAPSSGAERAQDQGPEADLGQLLGARH